MNQEDKILQILQRALDRGEAVEIEGIGTLSKVDQQFRFDPHSAPRVFVAYALEDLSTARRVCEELRTGGCSPWLDREELLPGQNWKRAIRHAIEDSDAFIALFSSRSVAKKGQFQRELRHGLGCAQLRPLDATFLIPARLDDCAVPEQVAARVQYVDLFPDWPQGIKRLVRAVRRAARSNRQTQALLIPSGH